MGDEESLTERGAELRDAERHAEAIPVLRQAVARGEPDAPRLLALALIELDDRPAARQVLSDAVDQGRVDLAGLLGDVADDLNDTELAERAYQLAIDSGDPKAPNDYGVFLSQRG